MNMNNSLVNALNAAIEKRGFRVSPRLPLGDRLARYTQLYYESQGRWIDEDDARAAASMMMLKYSERDRNARNDTLFDGSTTSPAKQTKAPRRKSVPPTTQPTQPTQPTQQSHHMTRRSQVAYQ